ncbi:MAG: hypothetical protein ABFC88_02060 [Thermoguttaceae bacterium]
MSPTSRNHYRVKPTILGGGDAQKHRSAMEIPMMIGRPMEIKSDARGGEGSSPQRTDSLPTALGVTGRHKDLSTGIF